MLVLAVGAVKVHPKGSIVFPLSILLLLFLCICLLVVLLLLCFHTFLILTNQTTYEVSSCIVLFSLNPIRCLSGKRLIIWMKMHDFLFLVGLCSI